MTPERARPREQLDTLYNISRVLNSTHEVDQVLQKMLDMVLESFAADAGSVMLESDGFLTIEVSQGLPYEIVAATRQQVGDGIAGWVALTGEPLHLDGKVDDPRFSELVDRKDEILSSLCVPIHSRERTVGVMMIRRVGGGAFGKADLAFLESVSDLASVALENARLFQAEREQRHLLELEHQKLQATLASMADGVVVVDKSGDILTANSVARTYLKDLVADDLSALWMSHREIFAGGESSLSSGERELSVAPTPLYVNGSEAGSVLVFRDETARRELQRMKSDFLSMVSHELKTPITTIGAFLELLLARDFEGERRKHFLEICQDECRRLHSLIEELLSLTRLETGRFALRVEECQLGSLVRACLPAFEETSSSHSFKLKEPFPDPVVSVDPMLVTQAVTNLLSNAVKYSPEGGEVTLGLEIRGELVTLWVKDQGVGIEEEKLASIFEKFYRIDNSLTRSTGGTGLGLANVKHIAEAHGGRAWALSRAGHGSRFYLELPMKSGERTHVTG